jgi:hypothetical protein
MQHPLYTFRSKDRIQKKERRRKKKKKKRKKKKKKKKETGQENPVPIGPYSHRVHAPENSWLCLSGTKSASLRLLRLRSRAMCGGFWSGIFFQIQFGSALAGFVLICS